MSQPSDKHHQYQPLHQERGEIRLLTLLPWKTSDPEEQIRCSMEHFSHSELDYTPEYDEWSRDLRDHVPSQTLLPKWIEHVKSNSKTPDSDTAELKDKPTFNPCTFRYQWGDYISISYIWGTSERTKAIILNGCPFGVTENLYSALRNLQFLFHGNGTDSDPKIWADAICINQDDPDERSHEVRRMRSIYSDAYAITVSLGDGFEDSNRTLKLMREISPSIATGIQYQAFKQQNSSNHKLLLELAEPVLKLSYHPYWNRVWVIQELTLAPDPVIITCGTSWAYLHELRVVYLFMNLEMASLIADGVSPGLGEKYHTINSGGLLGRYDIAKSVNRSLAKLDKKSFTELGISTLSLGIMANSTDPLDHMYGLLGLFPKYLSDKIIIDYSMSVHQAYAHLSRIIIEETQDLDFLFLRNQKQDMNPTWCTDWTRGFDRYYTFHERSFNYDIHVESYERARQFTNSGKDRLSARADKSQPFNVVVSDDGTILNCQAVFIGKVEGLSAEGLKLPGYPPVSEKPDEITQPMTFTNPYGETDGAIKALLATLSMNPAIEDTPGNRIMFKVPWCGAEADADIENGTRQIGQGFQTLAMKIYSQPTWAALPTIGMAVGQIEFIRRALGSFRFAGKPFKEYFPPTDSDLESMPEPDKVMSPKEISLLLVNLLGRRMVVLETGHFGLVPAVSRPGDEVWVVMGASMPIVLRRQKDSEVGRGSFGVVGECYIEGFMSGEAIDDVEKGLRKAEDIVLC
ncbi:heterokaryon incompatibility protein-domain-containing protein [Tricladium varicosporioides]|nr:heterokaryon incompatibility protein-domain-containing protein [Hymenoscyphus varicosporioides]